MPDNNSLLIGRGCIENVRKVLLANGIKNKVLFVSDEIVNNLYGRVIIDQLDGIDCEKIIMSGDSTISYAMYIAENVISNDIECIVGVGGGKVLDVCKYAAYVSKKDLLSIPTTAANDGISSPIAVLKKKDGKPRSLGCRMPTMLIVDTEIIESGPVELIKAGIGDTISNYMALKDWEYAVSRNKDVMNGYAYLMSKTSLNELLKTQYNCICPEFIDVLVSSLVLSGLAMDFAKSSRPVSGSEHLFSHALDYYAEKKNLHGIQVALGTITILKIMGEEYRHLLNYLRTFEVDINPVNLGIDKKTFIFCLQMADNMRKDRYTYLREIDLDSNKLSIIYDELVEEL